MCCVLESRCLQGYCVTATDKQLGSYWLIQKRQDHAGIQYVSILKLTYLYTASILYWKCQQSLNYNKHRRTRTMNDPTEKNRQSFHYLHSCWPPSPRKTQTPQTQETFRREVERFCAGVWSNDVEIIHSNEHLTWMMPVRGLLGNLSGFWSSGTKTTEKALENQTRTTQISFHTRKTHVDTNI